MKQYVVVHNHRFGFSTYFFRSEADVFRINGSREMEEKLAKVLGIDFEPGDWDEDLTITEIQENHENPVVSGQVLGLV